MDNTARSRSVRSVVAAAAFIGLWSFGCNSNSSSVDAGRTDLPSGGDTATDGTPDQPGDLGGGGSDATASDGAMVDAACTPILSCTGFCGSFKDQCTGDQLSCGPCPTGDVCDTTRHICTKPLTSCQQLGAECGLVKTSCGKRIDCGTCSTGQECDPDTHRCVTCSGVTCQDLGYECGTAWLGCGPTSNTTSCGACPGGKTCNATYHVCEPSCTPASAATVCAAAKTARGVQCGQISDGCGGTVDCGNCPTGQGCGQFGVANRCDPITAPDECAIQGKNCGTITSACGGSVNCGSCQAPDVCNANNVCGPACTPKKCVDFAPLECGSFDDGCNGTLNCGCPGTGATCKSDNTCCTFTGQCAAGSCNTSITNTCTGAVINCNTCTGTQWCDTSSNTCKARLTCADLGKGGTNTACNDNVFYDLGGGTKTACACSGGRLCINDSATQEGQCCLNANPVCAAVNQPGSCNTTVTNSCTGAQTTCTCPANYHCDVTTCVANLTCPTYTNGKAGSQCSNGPSPQFPNGAGGNLTCGCGAGMACVDANSVLVTGGTVGTCKVKKTCADYSVTPSNVGGLGDVCSNGAAFSDDAGGSLTCKCKSTTNACADATDKVVSGAATGVCKLKKSCADYSATGAVGSACNNSAFFDDGFGTKLTCQCTMTGLWTNNKCIGGTSTAAGTCQCTPTACTCANSGQSDGCGGTLNCPCGSGSSCVTSKAICCPNTSCTALPAGIPAGACGAVPDSCRGTNLNCACDTSGGKTNNTCVIPTGQTYGACQCTPNVCTGQVGVFDDGCGGKITCTG